MLMSHQVDSTTQGMFGDEYVSTALPTFRIFNKVDKNQFCMVWLALLCNNVI